MENLRFDKTVSCASERFDDDNVSTQETAGPTHAAHAVCGSHGSRGNYRHVDSGEGSE